jgi:hypothetical protein
MAVAQVVTAPDELFFVFLFPALVVLSGVEFWRWQRNLETLPISGRRGTKAYPWTAWFPVGGAIVAVAVALIAGVVTGLSGRGVGDAGFRLLGIGAWVIGGWGFAWFLTRNAKRRDALASTYPPMPPPPSG